MRLRLFGPPALEIDGNTALGPGKPLALLAYLACTPGRTASRERLIDLLWGDLEPSGARQALRQTIWHVRKRISESILETANESVRLADAVASDQLQFLEAIESRQWERALALYRGPFFEGFAAPGAIEFERWSDGERRRYLDHALGVSDDRSLELLQSGRARDAAATARRARDLEPLDLRSWRRLLESLDASGDRVLALAECEALDRLSADEGIDVDPTTRAVKRRIRSATALHDIGNAGEIETALVGRAQHFRRIMDAWQMAAAGRGYHCHIAGPAGIGKSRLLADVAKRLSSLRVKTVLIRATIADRAIPFSLAAALSTKLASMRGAAGISEGARAAILSLAPSATQWLTGTVDNAVGEEALRRRAIAVSELVASVSAEGPLALLIDDVHWADPESSRLISGVAAHLDSSRTLLISAARQTLAPPNALADEDVIRLTALSHDDVAELVASLGNNPREEQVDTLTRELYDASAGLPLLVVEILHLCRDRGVLQLHSGEWSLPDVDALRMAIGSGRTIERRLSGLSDRLKSTLDVIALVNGACSVDLVATVLAKSAAEVDDASTTLERLGLIFRDSGLLYPVHDEISASASAVMADDVRARLHEGIAEALLAATDNVAATTRRAIWHAGRSGKADVAARAVRQLAMLGARDERPAVTREWIAGVLTADTLVRAEDVYSRMPFSLRHRSLFSWPTAVVAAAASVAIALAAAVMLRGGSAVDEIAQYRLFVRSDAGLQLFEAKLDSSAGASIAPIRLSPVHDAALNGPGELQSTFSCWPRKRLADLRMTSDNRLQIVVDDANGESVTLTSGEFDELPSDWSPDCRSLVVLSNRLDRVTQHLDVALFDVDTRSFSPVTRTPSASESGAKVSRDGMSLAFLRNHYTNRPAEVCVVGIDGQNEHCAEVGWGEPERLLAWDRDSSVLVTVVDTAGLRSLVRVELPRFATSTVHSGAANYFVAPDGRYALIEAVGGTREPLHWQVADLARQNSVRALQFPSGVKPDIADVRWVAPPSAARVVSSIDAKAYAESLSVSVPTRIVATGRTVEGQSVGVGQLRFRSLDSLARVDENGVVQGRAAGRSRIEVSSAGHLTDTVLLRFTTVPDASRIVESGTALVPNRWVFFGEPAPRFTTSDGETALELPGDERFTTGILTQRTLSAKDGVGAEFSVSAKITKMQWQAVWASFSAVSDSLLGAWRERSGARPLEWAAATRASHCEMQMPAGEAFRGWRRIGLSIAGSVERIRTAPSGVLEGNWHRMRLQVFPDGRCGVAIDGTPLWLSRGRVETHRPLRFEIAARAVQTSIRVRGIEVWEGVRGGVDWRGAVR